MKTIASTMQNVRIATNTILLHARESYILHMGLSSHTNGIAYRFDFAFRPRPLR